MPATPMMERGQRMPEPCGQQMGLDLGLTDPPTASGSQVAAAEEAREEVDGQLELDLHIHDVSHDLPSPRQPLSRGGAVRAG